MQYSSDNIVVIKGAAHAFNRIEVQWLHTGLRQQRQQALRVTAMCTIQPLVRPWCHDEGVQLSHLNLSYVYPGGADVGPSLCLTFAGALGDGMARTLTTSPLVNSVVLPGDQVLSLGALAVSDSGSTPTVRVGASLRQDGDSVLATRAGTLQQTGGGKLWVSTAQRRYTPAPEDCVIGVVCEKHAEVCVCVCVCVCVHVETRVYTRS